MPKHILEAVKDEAVRLPLEERLGLKAIRERTGLSIGTLSTLLRPYPLPDEEIRNRIASGTEQGRRGRKPYSPTPSRFAGMIDGQFLDRRRKAQIAEAAVLFRLALFGYEAWRSAFEGHRVDWLVTQRGLSPTVRLQVWWARRGRHGRPYVSLRRQHGRIRISAADCDFVVAYDLQTDTAFVIPMAEIADRSSSTFCNPQYAEAWGTLFESRP